MDDKARIYEDISWLPESAPRGSEAARRANGSGRARTLMGTAVVVAIAGAVGFGGAVLVHESATASTIGVVTTSGTTTPSVVAPQTTTSTFMTTTGGS